MINNQKNTHQRVLGQGLIVAGTVAGCLLWGLCLAVASGCTYGPESFCKAATAHSSGDSFVANFPDNTLADIQETGTLTVVTRYSPTTYYHDKYGPSGFEYALAARFAEELNVRLEIVVADSQQEMITALQTGRADIAAAGLTVAKGRDEFLQFGTPYLDVTQQVIYRADSEQPQNLGQLNPGNIAVTADSNHSTRLLAAAKKKYPKLRWEQVPQADTVDLMNLVDKGKIDYTVVNSNEFLAYQSLFPGLEVAFDLVRPQQFRWAMAKQPGNQDLHQAVVEFFQNATEDGSLRQLKDQYYGHTPSINQTGLVAFAENRRTRLPKYKELIKSIADEHDISWHLLAAIGYEESRWDPKAVSPTGVKGMMMLTHDTAKEMRIADRTNVEQSLRGAARYFKHMLAKVPKEVTGRDRLWFAVAAYNLGIGHVFDAQKITRQQGGDPAKWVDIKKSLPLLQQRQWYSKTRHGYARGQNSITYVQNIRRYYHLLTLHDLA